MAGISHQSWLISAKFFSRKISCWRRSATTHGGSPPTKFAAKFCWRGSAIAQNAEIVYFHHKEVSARCRLRAQLRGRKPQTTVIPSGASWDPPPPGDGLARATVVICLSNSESPARSFH